MKIHPVGVETIHVDGRTGRHDEANGRFLNFANAPKKAVNFANAPKKAVNFANAPKEAVNFATAPKKAVNFANAPKKAVNFANAPKKAVISSVRTGTGHLYIIPIQALRIVDQSLWDTWWTRENGTGGFSNCLRDFPSGSFHQ